MTIGRKISILCGALVATAALVGTIALVNLRFSTTALDRIRVDNIPGILAISRLDGISKDIRGRVILHLTQDNPAEMDRIASNVTELQGQFRSTFSDYEKTVFTAEDRALTRAVPGALEEFVQVWHRMRALGREGKQKDAVMLFTSEGIPKFQEFTTRLTAVIDYNRRSADANSQQAAEANTTASTWIWAVLVVALAAGGVCSFLTVRSVNRALRDSIAHLAASAEQVATASGQVSASSQSLAQGASEQAASLQETSASTEEISSMTRKSVDHCATTTQVAAEIGQHVRTGNQTLSYMVSAMQDISGSSERISKIIRVIDEIAFQTNILALNAAVEAARAGEAGMGFAVVADEVRSLAQRCAQAAKDTSELIEESIAKSHDGNAKVSQVSSVFEMITESAGRMKSLVDEVHNGSREQAHGIEQIARAVAQMEQVTQGTAASAEESAAASEELSAHAEGMRDIVAELRQLV